MPNAYVRDNPPTLTDPSGMDSSCDSSNGCISINIGGVCLLFCGGHSEDRQPPIYTPPDTQNTTDPNPPAGDPDPSDPFSGPVWQEVNLPIQPLNLASLFGVPNAPGLVINQWTGEVGISVGWIFPWGINVNLFVGLSIDLHGHVAVYHGRGFGASAWPARTMPAFSDMNGGIKVADAPLQGFATCARNALHI